MGNSIFWKTFNPFWDATLRYMRKKKLALLTFNPFWDATWTLGFPDHSNALYTFNPFWDATRKQEQLCYYEYLNFQSLLGCNSFFSFQIEIQEGNFQSLLGCNIIYPNKLDPKLVIFQSLLGCNQWN